MKTEATVRLHDLAALAHRPPNSPSNSLRSQRGTLDGTRCAMTMPSRVKRSRDRTSVGLTCARGEPVKSACLVKKNPHFCSDRYKMRSGPVFTLPHHPGKEVPMSYSFSVKAADKAEALKLAGEHLDKIIVAQAAHQRDREPALAAAAAYIDLVEAPGDRKLVLSMHGSLSWASNDPERTYGAGVGISVHLD